MGVFTSMPLLWRFGIHVYVKRHCVAKIIAVSDMLNSEITG